MLITSILSNTPVWVWVLLAFLVQRGLKARHPQEMPPWRALIIPGVFLAWSLIAICNQLVDWSTALAAFAVALAFGFAAGWINTLRLPAARYNPETGLMWRPGSAMTLVLIVVAFCAKYTLNVALAMEPQLAAQVGFALLFGAIAGLVSGAFWGGTALQFRRAFAPRAVLL